MSNRFHQLSVPAQRALEVFSDEFRTALALDTDVQTWAQMLGSLHTSNAIKTTYPIPVHAAGYTAFDGNMRYRSLYSRTLSMKSKEWQDGVREKKQIVEAPDFMGWGDQPAAMALEAQRAPNDWVTSVLEGNPNLDFYRDEDTGAASTIALFAATHPYNVLDTSVGTFDNDLTGTAIDTALIVDLKQHFRDLKGPNGKPLGTRLTHLLVPAAREEEAKDFLERDMLIKAVTNVAGNENVAAAAERNRHYGTVELIVADELTSDDLVYAFALNKPGLKPWIVQSEGAPEQIVHDESDAMYKSTLMVGLSYILRGNAAAALPHPIARVTLS